MIRSEKPQTANKVIIYNDQGDYIQSPERYYQKGGD